jgi:ribosome-binding protein aMBF1 (putative translation factor)
VLRERWSKSLHAARCRDLYAVQGYASRGVWQRSQDAYAAAWMDEDLAQRFGARVRALREQRKLSQLDMVRQYGVSLSHYQRVERGAHDVKLTTIAKLADFFGVTLAQMMRGV